MAAAIPSTSQSIYTDPKWRFGKLLGEGSYGRVLEMTKDSHKLAIKTVSDVSMATSIEREREVYKLIPKDHPLFLNMHEHGPLDSGGAYLIVDLFPGNTLWKYAPSESPALPLEKLVGVVNKVVSALVFLRMKKVLHCDVNPNNILFDEKTGRVKLVDFGLSTVGDAPKSSGVNWFEFTPPSVLKDRKEYSYEVDVWGLGCTVYALLGQKFPFKFDLTRFTRELRDKISQENDPAKRASFCRALTRSLHSKGKEEVLAMMHAVYFGEKTAPAGDDDTAWPPTSFDYPSRQWEEVMCRTARLMELPKCDKQFNFLLEVMRMALQREPSPIAEIEKMANDYFPCEPSPAKRAKLEEKE